MLIHRVTLCAQPLYVALVANVRAIPARWVPACAFRPVGFSWTICSPPEAHSQDWDSNMPRS
eukprot:6399650-Pyramimonas_sp.AAC.1